MSLRVHLASLLATSVLVHSAVASSAFTGDLAAAREKAKKEHKDVFVDFTGSDWCGFCVALDKEVFNTPEFTAEAPQYFELVQLDFPQDKTKQSAEVTAQNKAWKSELGSRSFPDVLVLDENGRVFARTGYRQGGAKVYLQHMEDLRQRRIQRDAALAKAETAQGLEKAKHLDAALSALRNDDVLLTYYTDTIKEITALDPQDQAGLRTKYNAVFARKKYEREIDLVGALKDGAQMLAKYKEYAERTDIPVESRQYALYMAGALACERILHDAPQGLEFVNQALALAPKSELAEERLGEAKTRLEGKIAKAKAKSPAKP